MIDGQSVFRNARIIAIATVISRFLGFVKATLLVAAIGGTSAFVGGQAFEVANSASVNLFNLIAGGLLGAVLVPSLVRAFQDRKQGQQTVDQVFSAVIVGGVILTIALVFLAPLVVSLYAAGWSDQWKTLATTMAYWCLAQVFFLILFALLSQALNALERFMTAAIAPIASNLIAILGIALFMTFFSSGKGEIDQWTDGMVALLCGSFLFGTVVQAGLVFTAARRAGIRFHLTFKLNRLNGIGKIAAWTLSGILVGQASITLVTNIAAAAGEALNKAGVDAASLNSLALASLVVLVPHGVLAVSEATAIFPRVSKLASQNDFTHLAQTVQSSSSRISWLILMSTGLLVVEARPMSLLLWGSEAIGGVLQVLCVGLIGISQAYLLNRANFALADGVASFVTQSTIAVVGAAGAVVSFVVLPAALVIPGIAATAALSNIAGWIVAEICARRKTGESSLSWGPLRGWRHYMAGCVAALGGQLFFALWPWQMGRDFRSAGAVMASAGVVVGLYIAVSLITRDRTIREVFRKSV